MVVPVPVLVERLGRDSVAVGERQLVLQLPDLVPVRGQTLVCPGFAATNPPRSGTPLSSPCGSGR
jgi:hypothetical protein